MEKGNRSETLVVGKESNYDVDVTPSPTNPASQDSIETADDGMFLMLLFICNILM